MINPMELSGKQILLALSVSELSDVIISQLCKLGAKVVVISNSEGNQFEISDSIRGNVAFYSFDIYNNVEIEIQLNKIHEEFGVFNSFVFAGGIGGVRSLSFTKYSFVQEMMNANLFSFIEMVRCITKKGCFASGGSIVAISSVSSIKGIKSKTGYSASKAALDASVRCIAAELSLKKIRVNSILKGWLESDMEIGFIKSNMELNENNDLKKQLLGTINSIEVANLVAFLLSDATKTITGTSLLLDGGYTL